MRSGMVQVFAFQVNICTVSFRQPVCQIKGRWPPDIISHQLIELSPEAGIFHNFQILLPKFLYVGVEHLKNIGTSERTVIPFFVNLIFTHMLVYFKTLSNNVIFFIPGDFSKREFKSIAYKRSSLSWLASPMLSGPIPPLKK